MMEPLDKKYLRLKTYLGKLGGLIIAFSGGIDSTLLLKVAHDELGKQVLAVTSDSPSVARSELDEAARIAKEIGARHLIISTNELEDENYARNPANRCYFCKNELYSKLTQIARREGIKFIANGTNVDDLGDYRPGLEAAREFEVVSPLKEAGLTKADIRELAKKLGLRIWDKPATPCLSSRIPYGQSVTFEKLSVIEKAEAYLKSLNIREVRVRHFGTVARIETPLPDFEIIQRNMERIKKQIYSLGFKKMEWKEFKSGALNIPVINHSKS